MFALHRNRLLNLCSPGNLQHVRQSSWWERHAYWQILPIPIEQIIWRRWERLERGSLRQKLWHSLALHKALVLLNILCTSVLLALWLYLIWGSYMLQYNLPVLFSPAAYILKHFLTVQGFDQNSAVREGPIKSASPSGAEYRTSDAPLWPSASRLFVWTKAVICVR